jgi:hypothetical protein
MHWRWFDSIAQDSHFILPSRPKMLCPAGPFCWAAMASHEIILAKAWSQPTATVQQFTYLWVLSSREAGPMKLEIKIYPVVGSAKPRASLSASATGVAADHPSGSRPDTGLTLPIHQPLRLYTPEKLGISWPAQRYGPSPASPSDGALGSGLPINLGPDMSLSGHCFYSAPRTTYVAPAMGQVADFGKQVL